MADAELASPAGAVSRQELRRSRRRGRRKRTAVKVTAIALTVLVLLVGGVAGYGYYLYSKIHRINVRGLTAAPTTGKDAGTENILMVGSTDRCALTVQYTAYGLCSQGVNGVNSDVVMILHLNSATHSVSILSIPRDLFVPNARKDGANKIDAALYQGPEQLVAAIQDDFGIPIQDYVELNFNTFANVVNALGGVNMYFPEPVYDSYSDLNQPAHRLHPPRRLSRPPGRPGPPPAVQASRRHDHGRGVLAPGGPERSRPHPARPRVPPCAGRRRGQERALEPDHRCPDHQRCGPTAPDDAVGVEDGRSGAQLPWGERGRRSTVHPSRPDRDLRQLLLPGRQLRRHRVSRPRPRTARSSTSSSASRRPRTR